MFPLTHKCLSVFMCACAQNHVCGEEVKDYLISQCKAVGSPCLQQFSTLLRDPDKNTALLISQRFLNIPVDIVPWLLRSLM